MFVDGNAEEWRAKPGELLDALVAGRDRWVAMFKVIVDASGHHRGSSLISVAACVARPEEWKRFEMSWRATLASAGVDHFHAKDNSCDRLRGPLLNAVQKAQLPFAVVASSNPAEYERSTGQHYRSRIGGTLASCAVACATQVHNWTVIHGGDPSLYVFEEGDPGLDHIVRIFNGLMVKHPDNHFRVVGVSVVKKKELPELAPSDFLSHTKSTADGVWLNRWKQHCDVLDYPIPPRELSEASDEVSRLIRRFRWKRRSVAKANRRVDHDA